MLDFTPKQLRRWQWDFHQNINTIPHTEPWLPNLPFQRGHWSTFFDSCRDSVSNPSSLIFNDPDKAAKQFPVPVMQCLQVKQMAPSAQGGDRYRLVMSDGQHYVQTMLATQANHVVHEDKLVRGCIARIKQYTPNNLKGKK